MVRNRGYTDLIANLYYKVSVDYTMEKSIQVDDVFQSQKDSKKLHIILDARRENLHF